MTEVRHAKGSPSLAAGRRPVDAALWLLLAVSITTALRIFRLGQNSLWVDEFASLQVARLPLAEIPAAALHGSAFEPPIYFWLLHVSIAMFGSSESALRALSVTAGILTVPLVWLLMRDLAGGNRSATLVALLLAVNPLHLWYSQEARPYALSLFFGLASLLCLRIAMRGGSGVLWMGYTVFGALAILSHLAGIVVPAVGTGLVLLHERRWRLAPRFVAFSTGIGLLIVPFLLALANSIEPGSAGSPPRALTGLEVPYSLFTYVAGYSFGPSVREIQNSGWREAVSRHTVQTFIAAAALAAIAALVLHARRKRMWPLGVLLIVPLAVPILGSLITSKAFNVRYTLLALIGFLGLAGAAVAALKPGARRVAFAALLALSLWADAQWFLLSRYWKEDSRAAVTCLAEWRVGDSTVAVAPEYMKGVVEYYARRAGHRMEVVGVSTVDQLPSGFE
ncbi:MAG: glycosyltransferase family 39 protein [candidate division Zixibacteria bacterium]|nr:glycosyltransferase family 39 protein [candidate division Zixibacteria bacterium]